MEALNAGEVGINRDRPRYRQYVASYRSMTCWTCEQQVRQSTVQFTAQTATYQWNYHSLHCSMHDHDEEKKT